MITYNHYNFISQAIDSILQQKTKYEYEIIIGDDYSKDGTQEILKEYKQKYPDIIKLILREKNIGATNNFYDVLLKCKGEYIAILEGDDFWCDENKIQKQLNFLDNIENRDYIGVASNYYLVDKFGNNKRECSKSNFKNKYILPKLSPKPTAILSKDKAEARYRDSFIVKTLELSKSAFVSSAYTCNTKFKSKILKVRGLLSLFFFVM